jgi:hypothetical protein
MKVWQGIRIGFNLSSVAARPRSLIDLKDAQVFFKFLQNHHGQQLKSHLTEIVVSKYFIIRKQGSKTLCSIRHAFPRQFNKPKAYSGF